MTRVQRGIIFLVAVVLTALLEHSYALLALVLAVEELEDLDLVLVVDHVVFPLDVCKFREHAHFLSSVDGALHQDGLLFG